MKRARKHKKKTIAALLTMNEREKTMKKNTWT